MSKKQNLYVATIPAAGNSKEFVSAWIRNNGPTPKAPNGTERHCQVGSKDRAFVAQLLAVAEGLRQIRAVSNVTLYTDSKAMSELVDDPDIVPLLRRARNQKNPQLKKAAQEFQVQMARHKSVHAVEVSKDDPTLSMAYMLATHLKDNLAGHGNRKGVEVKERKVKARQKPNAPRQKRNMRAMSS